MTDQEINIAIAEACGWVKEPDHYYVDGIAWRNGVERCATIDLPDYCHDLNAMHDAEKVLGYAEQEKYWYELVNVADCIRGFQTLHTTARQRAEAFLRIKRLWKE